MEQGKEAPLAGRRVLVVEDEYLLADDLAAALSRAGAEVVGPVATAQEAFALIVGDVPSLAVLDIKLPGGVVFPVAEALAGRGVPFVFATGYAAASVPARFRAVPHWQKPFDAAALVAALGGDATSAR